MPFTSYISAPPSGLKPSHINALSSYLAPSYLTMETLDRLSQQFAAASEIVLHNFLRPELAARLKAETAALDKQAFGTRGLPEQFVGENDEWTSLGPPSKHRYLYLSTTSPSISTPTIQSILNTFFSSESFRAWLSVVSSLAPMGYRAEARRFRPGLDYTLAAGEEESGAARLDVWLGATWWADVDAGSEEEDALVEHGGWDCFLGSPEQDEDPTIYQSTTQKVVRMLAKEVPDTEEGRANLRADRHRDVYDDISANGQGKKNGHGRSAGEAEGDSSIDKKNSGNGDAPDVELEIDPSQLSSSDYDSDSVTDENDDEPLLSQPVSFNKLLLVLRDPGVVHFVKYLSAGARGSRWDIGGEWEVGAMEAMEAGDGDAQGGEVSR